MNDRPQVTPAPFLKCSQCGNLIANRVEVSVYHEHCTAPVLGVYAPYWPVTCKDDPRAVKVTAP